MVAIIAIGVAACGGGASDAGQSSAATTKPRAAPRVDRVESLGGSITINSQPGVGTIVQGELPLTP